MKILALVGTIQLPFTRMLSEIENYYINSTNIEIFAQIGHTPFESSLIQTYDFLKFDELQKLYIDADLIITHAGVGSIMQGLKLNKKMIVCARYSELGEHVDNHQLDILKEFSSKNYIIPWYKEDSIRNIINQIDSYSFKNFVSNKTPILEYLNNYINLK